MSNQEHDPFASPVPGSVPSFNASFETDVTEVGKLAGAMDNLSRSTDKADASLNRLSQRGRQVQSAIHGILSSAGLKTGTAAGGGAGNNNGGAPTVSSNAGSGRGNGGISSGGLGPMATADFGLDLARYVSAAKIPGYGTMQKQLAAGVSLDAYASQWAGAYGRAPSQIPSMLRRGNGGAIGTPDQVAAAAQYGASMGAIPGVTQQGNTYWSSIGQLQRMAPGMGPQQAAQISGNLLNPQSNTTIAQRYGINAAPIGRGGITKNFNQAAADILKALKMTTRAPGQLPSKEQLLAGLLPGSRMRQQMRVGMGLDDDTITMIINWGINNSTYQSRGGQGNYDPSDINQRKLATGSGTRDSLSNYVQTYQQAQTGRTTNFLQGQYGSLQDMTQMQTRLVNDMSTVDDAFKGLYAIVGPAGPVISGLLGMVGHLGGAIIALRAFSGSLGAAASSVGLGGAATGAGAAEAAGAGAAGAAGAGASGAVGGFAVGGAALSAVVQGYQSNQVRSQQGKKPTGIIPNILQGNFNPMDWFGDPPIGDPAGTAGLSGDFKKGLGRMMAANPNITVTSGYRSGSQQGALNRAGVGRVGTASDSWHVRGMAADLGPPSQFGWIAKNAQRFGLDSGARLGEPWHVQKGGTAGKRPPSNLAINQSARGAGQAYRPFKGAVGDLPGLTINDILTSRQASINASGLFSSRSTAAGTATSASGGASAGSASTVGSGQVDKVIAFLYAQIGKPYSASQPDGPDSWDCSGLVTGAYKEVGIILPSLTFSQVKMGTEVPIDPAAVRPGDALFMRGGSPSTDLGHVAVAVSSSEMISAPHTGAVVHKSNIPWGSIQAVRRYINVGSTPAKGVSTSGTWDDFLNAHMETSGKLDPSATLSGPQIAADFYNAGFRGSTLTDMVAISGRESGWNPTAFNFHAKSTGDVSLGLTQINVKGSMISRLKDYGLTDPRQLLDPNNAAHASFVLSSGGTNLSPWGGYKGFSNTYGTNMTSAQQAVDQARTQGLIGDLPVGGGSGGAMATGPSATPSSYAAMTLTGGGHGGGTAVTITNHFHIQTTGDAQGGMRVAQVAGQKLSEQFAARTT